MIRTRGQRHGGNAATPQGPSFDGRPTPPTALVQIVQQFHILVTNGFQCLSILHHPIMTLNVKSTATPISVTYFGAAP
jgi:hypothetical protein